MSPFLCCVPFPMKIIFIYLQEFKTRNSTLKWWFLIVCTVFRFDHHMHISFILLFSNNDKKGGKA